jgi:hypothetical protein
MEYDKAAKHLTEEIIHEFHLPTHLCYNFIQQRICMAIGIGFDIGRGPVHHNLGKCVVSIDRWGNHVKQYTALSIAARDVKGDPAGIRYAIKKKRMYKRFQWEFVDVAGLTSHKRKPPVNS